MSLRISVVEGEIDGRNAQQHDTRLAPPASTSTARRCDREDACRGHSAVARTGASREATVDSSDEFEFSIPHRHRIKHKHRDSSASGHQSIKDSTRTRGMVELMSTAVICRLCLSQRKRFEGMRKRCWWVSYDAPQITCVGTTRKSQPRC